MYNCNLEQYEENIVMIDKNAYKCVYISSNTKKHYHFVSAGAIKNKQFILDWIDFDFDRSRL